MPHFKFSTVTRDEWLSETVQLSNISSSQKGLLVSTAQDFPAALMTSTVEGGPAPMGHNWFSMQTWKGSRLDVLRVDTSTGKPIYKILNAGKLL